MSELELQLAAMGIHDDLQLATLGVHGDDVLNITSDVAPPLHVSTTYRYDNDPEKLRSSREEPLNSEGRDHVYSRISQQSTVRAEKVLGTILKGDAVLFSSGLSAFHAALLYYNPKNVFITGGYHGCHGVLNLLSRNYGVKVHPLDSDPSILQKGDVVHLETPINPTGESFDIEHYSKIAHERGAYLLIDATFAPPPLQDPFEFGADMVMHSATKYFGGHSDLLAGVVVSKSAEIAKQLRTDRIFTGAVPGSMESWLLLRSLRTFDYRIRIQSRHAEQIVKFLDQHRAELPRLKKLYHSSLQTESFVKKQLPLGGPPVFSIEVADKETARRLPSRLHLFNHATSLGGVESLIEWRCMSDSTVDETLLRVSIGIEDPEDLIKDLVQALK